MLCNLLMDNPCSMVRGGVCCPWHESMCWCFRSAAVTRMKTAPCWRTDVETALHLTTSKMQKCRQQQARHIVQQQSFVVKDHLQKRLRPRWQNVPVAILCRRRLPRSLQRSKSEKTKALVSYSSSVNYI